MRKFDLYDKVVVTKNGEKTNGCIVSFNTVEDAEGYILDRSDNAVLEPQEHLYTVLIGECPFDDGTPCCFEEFFESELDWHKADMTGTSDNPFAGTNTAILDMMKKNDMCQMHIEMFVSQTYDRACINRDYYDSLAETEATGNLKP